MKRLFILSILVLFSATLFAGCVTKVTPPPPPPPHRAAAVHRTWIPAHHNAQGVWVKGHWRVTR